eukprot:SAG25_NODE_191_length_12265_cov_16.310538_8_plen_159_part_00
MAAGVGAEAREVGRQVFAAIKFRDERTHADLQRMGFSFERLTPRARIFSKHFRRVPCCARSVLTEIYPCHAILVDIVKFEHGDGRACRRFHQLGSAAAFERQLHHLVFDWDSNHKGYAAKRCVAVGCVQSRAPLLARRARKPAGTATHSTRRIAHSRL